MKKFFTSRKGEATVLLASSIASIILNFILYSIKLVDNAGYDMPRFGVSLWSCKELYFDEFILHNLNLYLIIALVVGILLTVIAAVLLLKNNRRNAFFVSASYNIALIFAIIIIHIVCNVLRGGAIACAVLSALFSTLSLVYLILRKNSQMEPIEDLTKEISPRKAKGLKIGLLTCEIIAMAISFLLFVIPTYTETSDYDKVSYVLINALSFADGSGSIPMSICFVVMFFACFASLLNFVSSISFWGKSDSLFAKKSQTYMYYAAFLSILFFVMGYALTFYVNVSVGEDNVSRSASTVSYIPSILVMITLVVHSLLQGGLTSASDSVESRVETKKQFKFEPLIYIIILTAITFASFALVILDVKISYYDVTAYELKKTGYELIVNYKDLDAGLQVVSFTFVAILIVSSVLLVLSLVGYFTRSKEYYPLTKISAFTNFVFVLMVGLFGLYYKIAQKINSENLLTLLNQFDIPVSTDQYIESISTYSYFASIASFAVLIFMFARKQFNLSYNLPEADNASSRLSPLPAATAAAESIAPAEKPTAYDFDACPAFTELDGKIDMFEAALENKRQSLFVNLTLPNLVRFIVDYARESRLHLSYSLEDIATFVAGLGASRLAILQGMSGTGKTSLPKIFTEAIMGTCEIVEVESSWRDKNELLGYYNEFSKCFTPKKFTQCLYKARLNSSVPTFIVLDEMNLSRIEYYFSDFLSLMENEEHLREIKLLNVKLFRRENGQEIPYMGLTDGHTIKIPSNVWFIGTANRDESTFEISDKVYDRAQTMNF